MDADAVLHESPPWLVVVWIALVVLIALQAFDELEWIGGPPSLYQRWIPDVALVLATLAVFARAVVEPVARRAWVSFGLAMAVWCVGTVAWSVVYGSEPNPPYPSFADALWLLWYPLVAAGLVFLVRVRFRTFEVHRWMDGIGVMLMVLVVGFGLVVQPLADKSSHTWLSTAVNFSYPVLDVLLIGALLGVYGLLGWRPDAMWILIGMGIAACTGADAAFAVAEARGVVQSGHYDFVWSLGALFIAYAAWVRLPTVHDDNRQVAGMRAIALALLAQALAIAIQLIAIFDEIGKSERVVTALVLVVASIQIVLTRPKAGAATGATSEVAGREVPAPEDGAG